MIGLIAPLLLRIGIPERLHRVVSYVALSVLTIVLLWWLVRQYDAAVIERHDQKRESAASAGREKSAEEAVVDAFTNLRERDERDHDIATAEASEAVKPPEARAAVPPTTLARRCRQFRQAYTAEQLAKMPEFKEKCS